MFTVGLVETEQEEVELQEIDGAALESVINFAYTGRLAIGQANVQPVLEVSSLLHLIPIMEECCRFLRRELDPSNCLGIARFAEAYSCHHLRLAAERYTCLHFAEVAKEDEFFSLELTELLPLLSSDGLFVRDEDEVYRVRVFQSIDWLIVGEYFRSPFDWLIGWLDTW